MRSGNPLQVHGCPASIQSAASTALLSIMPSFFLRRSSQRRGEGYPDNESSLLTAQSPDNPPDAEGREPRFLHNGSAQHSAHVRYPYLTVHHPVSSVLSTSSAGHSPALLFLPTSSPSTYLPILFAVWRLAMVQHITPICVQAEQHCATLCFSCGLGWPVP